MTRRDSVVVRSPEDVLALVPSILGFQPEESLVLVSNGPDTGCFHARTDLPSDPKLLELALETLVRASMRTGASKAMAVAYTDDVGLALEAVERLYDLLEEVEV